MRCLKIILALTVLAVMVGCLPTSVHPLYKNGNVKFDSDLLGLWYDPDEPRGDVWSFRRWGPDSYRLLIYKNHSLSSPPAAEFDVRMCEVGSETYLDFFPREPEDMDEFYNLHLVPTHSFYRIQLNGDTLHIGVFDLEWLEEHLEKGGFDLKHERRDDMIVLTASTDVLQEFAKKYAREAFPITDESRLVRNR